MTNTCFEHFKVVHADGKYRGRHPLEIGPTFIHTGKDTNTFVGLFSSLLRMEPELKTIQAFGSDGDEAIMNAALICFPDAQKLLCTTHKKENIERKLKGDLRARDTPSRHILYDIFGRETSQVKEKGLIDSTTTASFDKKLMELKSTWDCLVPAFHSWFVKYETDVFKMHLIKEISTAAHLDDHFSNNRTESVNNNIKDWVGRNESLSLATVNGKIEEYVKNQQQEFSMVVYSNGPYELSNSHGYLRVSRHVWNGMPTDERRESINRFWSSPLVNRVSKCQDIEPEKITEPISSESILHKPLSVSHNDAKLTLSTELKAEIWEKAYRLLKIPGSVVKTPGYDALMVQHCSDSHTQTPHLVTSFKSGKFVCDCCPYKSFKICEHTIVASESLNKLSLFIQWREKDQREVNITKLVMSGISSGKKPATAVKPRRGGRTPLDKVTPELDIHRGPIIEDTSTSQTLQALSDMEREDPFHVIYLNQTKALKCYGCVQKFSREKEQNNLIVRKFCEREYTHGGEKKTKNQYAYFHLRNACIVRKFPLYKKEMLTVAQESIDIMPAEVKDRLLAMGVAL